MSKHKSLNLFIIIALLTLTGCGQKGPLVRPDAAPGTGMEDATALLSGPPDTRLP